MRSLGLLVFRLGVLGLMLGALPAAWVWRAWDRRRTRQLLRRVLRSQGIRL